MFCGICVDESVRPQMRDSGQQLTLPESPDFSIALLAIFWACRCVSSSRLRPASPSRPPRCRSVPRCRPLLLELPPPLLRRLLLSSDPKLDGAVSSLLCRTYTNGVQDRKSHARQNVALD